MKGLVYGAGLLQKAGRMMVRPDVIPIYLRDESIKLWKHLDEHISGGSSSVYIGGGPGAGKSASAFKYAVSLLKDNSPKTVL